MSMDKNQLYLNYLGDSDYYTRMMTGDHTIGYKVKELSEDCIINQDHHSPWVMYSFTGKSLKDQGWKIHVSATMDNAHTILETVSQQLMKRKVAFKHLVSERQLHSVNSKNGNRISSGKFITIYPATDEEFLELLHVLHEAIRDEDNGPYILSDKCWKDSNLYYRYGGFRSIQNEEGQLCIRDESGNLIPDNRTPYYQVPEFVKEFDIYLDSHNNIPENEADSSGLQAYEIQRVIRFNNGGGIYLAERKSDHMKVVIKEARPKVGLDGQNKDAIDRLVKEHEALSLLADVKGIVNVVDCFKAWKHLFVVEEFVEGIDLKRWLAAHYPFHRLKNTALYVLQVQTIITSLMTIVAEMHDRQVGMGDLQPSNVMITEDLKVILIDFESASDKDSEEKAAIHTIGFSDIRNKNHKERDWYAVKKILRYCVLPIGPVDNIEPSISFYHNEWIRSEFGEVFHNFVRNVERQCDENITAAKEQTSPDEQVIVSLMSSSDISSVIQGLSRGMLANLVPEQGLVHGDIRQYENSGGLINVLTGGTGAALALHRTGYMDSRVHEWLEASVLSHNTLEGGHGLLVGNAGIASTLYELGYTGEALERFSHIEYDDSHDVSLRSGLAGMGLAWLSLYLEERQEVYLDEARRIIAKIISVMDQRRPLTVTDWAAVPIGMIDGWSGVSVLFSAMYAVTGEEDCYIRARQLIEMDLEHSHRDEEVLVLQAMDEKKRVLPYLSGGSIGIGVAIWYFNHVTGKRHYEEELKLIINLNDIRCTFSGGILDGAGGFLLLPCLIEDDADVRQEHVKLSLQRLQLFLVARQDQVHFSGNFGYRLSEDWYTGSAGIMLALQGLQESNPLYWLPLIHINQFVAKTSYKRNEARFSVLSTDRQ